MNKLNPSPLGLRWSGHAARTVALVLLAAMPVLSQEKKDENKIPEPEDVSIITNDMVELRGTFYPGLEGKESVPVVLLHMYEGSRADFGTLPLQLQEAGDAVLAIDLRGHGESTVVRGVDRPLKASDLKTKADFGRMITQDMEAIKRWLMNKNNAGELNIEKLCVVGAEMGATIAVNWAAVDWSYRDLPIGKQGKDIKALVLLSPEQNFKGITLSGALKHPVIKDHLSYLIAYGDRNSSKNRRDAESLYNSLKQKRAEYETPEEIIDKKDLFDQSYKTSFQGTKMLGKDLGVEKHITNFIKLRLQDKSFPWAERKNPFES